MPFNESFFSFSVVILGLDSSGKTSLMTRWLGDRFPNENEIERNNFEFGTKTVKLTDKEMSIHLLVTEVGFDQVSLYPDYSGSRYFGSTPAFGKKTHAIFLCVDSQAITEKELLDRYKTLVKLNPGLLVYLVITKMDLVEELSKSAVLAESKKTAKELNIDDNKIMLMSAKNAEGGIEQLETTLINDCLKKYPQLIKKNDISEDTPRKKRLNRSGTAPRPSFFDFSPKKNMSINASNQDKQEILAETSPLLQKSTAKIRSSEIDSKLNISHERWTVTLMRKAGKDQNPEHVFLIVEGANQFGKPIVRRYDLVKHDKREGYAKIIISPKNEKYSEIKRIVNLTKGDECYYKTWRITKEQAAQLHTNIVKDQKIAEALNGGIRYFLSGDENVLVKLDIKEGQSCFTWARGKLRELNDDEINNDISSKIIDYLIVAPRLYLTAPEEENKCCDSPCLIL